MTFFRFSAYILHQLRYSHTFSAFMVGFTNFTDIINGKTLAIHLILSFQATL